MFSIKITRRQFLKWISASAAAMGLSQTDLLKVQEAFAAWPGPGPAPTPTFPSTLVRVLWLTGADCGGCPTTLLNYLADPNDTETVLKALATNGASAGLPALIPPLPVVGGIDVEALTPVQGADGNIDIAEVVVEIVTVDWHYIVMAASGDPANLWMETVRNSGAFVLAVDGAILTGASGKYCSVLSMPGDKRGGIWDPYVEYPAVCADGVTTLPRTDFTMAGATLWLASSPNCVAVVADGTCASFGGVPAAKMRGGKVTKAKSVWEWLNKMKKLNKIIVNIPGCPPNPDWQLASIGAAILEVYATILQIPPFTALSGILLNNLDMTKDHKLRPRLTYMPIYHNVDYAFCEDCPRLGKGDASSIADGQKKAGQVDGKCLSNVGCNGWLSGPAHIRPDCPTRMWNKFEDKSLNNWCVRNNMPCQGCASPGFPDETSPFYLKTKGFPYNY